MINEKKIVFPLTCYSKKRKNEEGKEKKKSPYENELSRSDIASVLREGNTISVLSSREPLLRPLQ